jgi:Kef-type K+ transport system membrane component KefB
VSTSDNVGTSQKFQTAVVYVLVLLAAIAIFFVIQNYGSGLTAPAVPAGATSPAAGGGSTEVIYHLLVALAAVVAVGRLLTPVFGWLGQPPVIGEVLGGILLGPSLLGLLSPSAYQFILPQEVAPYLGAIAQLGVIFYMFLVGLELNPEQLRGRIHSTIVVSHASIVVPFVLGAVLALYMYPRFSNSNVSFTNFALFLGLGMSITAFPVLARILSDCGLAVTKLGTIALTSAAIGDVTAWCLLALVVGIVQATGSSVLLITVMTLAFIAVMLMVVRPFAERLSARFEDRHPTQGTIAVAILGLLLSALTTEWIGIHALFGAFLFGSIFPHDSNLAHSLRRNMENLVTILFLPAFFAFTGMRTSIGLVSGMYEWLVCGLIIAVATLGKFGGALAAARLTGMGWRQSSALGVLMNTRGLMELIVLNVGLELGVISQKLFTMMVLMALVTTIATTPILQRLVHAPVQRRSTKPASVETSV